MISKEGHTSERREISALPLKLARGAGTAFCKKWQRIMISKKGHTSERREISALPLKSAGSQSLAQDKRSVLVH
jgi:hypothetical protein